MDTGFTGGRILHGLSYPFSDTKLGEQIIRVAPMNGVFPAFYSRLTQQVLPSEFPLQVTTLLGYCSDISHEFETAGYGNHRCLPAKVRFLIDSAQKHAFVVIGINRFELIEPFGAALASFYNYFEEVKPRPQHTAKQFGISEPNISRFRFFESRQKYQLVGAELAIPVPQMLAGAYASMSHLHMSNPFRDEFDCFVVLPLSTEHQLPLNELLAIYVVMFFLASLVRYNPEYLEKIIASKDGWLIERFCSSCTVTCLRHMGNVIEGVDKVYYPR